MIAADELDELDKYDDVDCLTGNLSRRTKVAVMT